MCIYKNAYRPYSHVLIQNDIKIDMVIFINRKTEKHKTYIHTRARRHTHTYFIANNSRFLQVSFYFRLFSRKYTSFRQISLKQDWQANHITCHIDKIIQNRLTEWKIFLGLLITRYSKFILNIIANSWLEWLYDDIGISALQFSGMEFGFPHSRSLTLSISSFYFPIPKLQVPDISFNMIDLWILWTHLPFTHSGLPLN